MSAFTASEREIAISRGGWRTRVETQSMLSATADEFMVTNSIDAYEGEVRVYSKSWYRSVPRNGV